MDDIDRTQDRMDKELSLFFKQHHVSYKIDGTGVCLHCKGVVKPTIINNKSIIGRWCSSRCRDKWSIENEH